MKTFCEQCLHVNLCKRDESLPAAKDFDYGGEHGGFSYYRPSIEKFYLPSSKWEWVPFGCSLKAAKARIGSGL